MSVIVNYDNKKIEESIEETADILSTRLGKLETKAIRLLIEDMELYKILEKYLSKKEQDVYYKSKYKLIELLKSNNQDNKKEVIKNMPELEKPMSIHEEFNNATNHLTKITEECPNVVAYVESNWFDTTTIEDVLYMVKRHTEELKANPTHVL